MKVCLTGGTGFLGRWFLELAPDDVECVVLSRNVQKPTLEVTRTDYSYDSLETIFDNESFDAVVHLAGRKIEEEHDLSDYLEANTLLTDTILRLCMEFSIDNVVTASSRMVYSSENPLPWNEEDSPKPVTYYGLSKILKDKLVIYYNNNYKLRCKSLRFAQVFGIDIGRDLIHTRLFKTFIGKAINKEPLPVYGKGEDRKEYIYVKDAVDAIFSALENRHESGIFNIGLGENNTVLDIAKLINEVFENTENGCEFLHEKDEKNEKALLDITKSREVLNFEPSWNIKEALYDIKETIENDYDGL